MKELKDFTTEELKAELNHRDDVAWKEMEEESRTLPTKYLPYEMVTELHHDNDETPNHKFFIANVDDGSEGFSYLIQYEHKMFDGVSEDDPLINDTIKHSYLTDAINDGWDGKHDGINIMELGRYGLNFIKIDGTKR